MRLKRVRIFGFKTFADRTEFNLDGGIIAVVGPNGCGKSNLVDAILWGLGEGNARQLRAQSGQDVIFGGSSRRKPVGFAEVTLLFDNEDGSLPIDSPEVTVTRRLNRAGESEYSINRHNCRLRDIYELLADSGLGRAGYAIVGQKEIDSALAASAEDRRGWVDEAAGVQRYRSRKVESLRRLDTAQEHLSRVEDILSELASQRAPLEDEARQAMEYKRVSAALREVEMGLLVNEVALTTREVEGLHTRIEDSMRLVKEELARADDLENGSRATGEKISELELELDSLRGLQTGCLTALERAEANLRLMQQKLATLGEQEQTLSGEADVSQQRIDEAVRELDAQKKESEGEEESFGTLESELAGAGDEAKALSASLKAIDKELVSARDAKAAQLKQEAERAHRVERRTMAQRELKGILDSLPELQAAVAEAETAREEQAGCSTAIQDEIKALENKTVSLRQEEDKHAQSVRRALADKAALEGRHRGIEATIEAHEGLNQGSRAVIEAVVRGHLQGSYIPVGQAVEADKDVALAIETALGGSIHDLIVDHESDAKSAIEWLKQERAGRATFQPIPLMRPVDPSYELKRLADEKGVLGRASELVRCANRIRPVIDSLLGRVLVVEHIDVALNLARTSGWSRLVTLDGEVVHSGGAVTGGRQSRQGYGLVQRKADLNELESEIARLDVSLKEMERRSALRVRERQEIELGISEARRRLTDHASELNEARSFAQTLNDELKSALRSKEKLESEIERLNVGPSTEAPIDVESIEQHRDDVLRQLAAKSADAEQAEARLREAQARVLQARARVQGSEKRLHAAREAEESRLRKMQHLEPDREHTRREIERFEREHREAGVRKHQTEEQLAKLQVERRSMLEESLRLTEDAKSARANATSLGEAAHQMELNRARFDSRRATAQQRLLEEYGLSEEDALEQEGLHEVPQDAQAVVSKLRRELKAMGDVNLGAIEAFERLNLRWEELTAQKADIESGIEQVHASIAELDRLTRDKFVSTFGQVQVAFSEMFLRLFGGGEGSMRLTDPDRVLDSGIEIEVTLPGKKRQALNLLSGGERALCASAFLFALLRVKPSPLVVLDEVDAPLDGRNVERFAEALRSFTDRTQFIVITHNPTTIESAPVWLGVTMQEPGVSTLVPARIPEAKAVIAAG